MKVLVCGGRDFSDKDAVKDVDGTITNKEKTDYEDMDQPSN